MRYHWSPQRVSGRKFLSTICLKGDSTEPGSKLTLHLFPQGPKYTGPEAAADLLSDIKVRYVWETTTCIAMHDCFCAQQPSIVVATCLLLASCELSRRRIGSGLC